MRGKTFLYSWMGKSLLLTFAEVIFRGYWMIYMHKKLFYKLCKKCGSA